MRPAPAAEPNPLSQVFLDGAVAAGFPLTDDFNGAVAEGAGWHDLSISAGVRQSTAAAYLHPLDRRRSNLTVSTHSRARRLLFSRNRCTGVEYIRGGELVTAFADAEVVLSAGAVDSPRLLLLSGVGRGTTCLASDVTCTTTRCAVLFTKQHRRFRPAETTSPRRRCCGVATNYLQARTCN